MKWKHEEVGDEDHNQSRLLLNYHGLRYLFSDLKNMPQTADNFDSESFLKTEKQLMEKYGALTRRPAMEYVMLYSALLEQGNTQEAITVLKRATEAYPMYIGLLNNLAQLYEKNKQTALAIETYETAIAISKKYKLGYEEGYAKEIKRLKG